MEKNIINSWSVEDWAKGKIIVDNIKIPAVDAKAQSQLRTKRKINFQKITGKVFYFDTDLIAYLEKSRVLARK